MNKILPNTGEKTVATIRQAEILTVSVQTTVATTMTDLAGSKIDAGTKTLVGMVITNTGSSNGLSWQVVGSIDDITYVTVQSSANVAALASGTFTTATPFYRYYKIQMKDQADASHTTATATVIAK